MVQWSRTTTADVLICFQQNPGAADGIEVIEAGEGWIEDHHGPVKPQGQGYYGLKMGIGDTRYLNLFGTRYEIHLSAKNALGFDAGVERIAAWDDIWDQSGNLKVQCCLQLLGYYKGPMDNILGRHAEEAMLAFQADNNLEVSGLRWLRSDDDGDNTDPDGNALDEIVKIVNNKNKIGKQGGGAVYLIRKSLIRFARSPDNDPNIDYGPAALGAPDVDDRGFGRAKANGHKCRGPVTSYSYIQGGNNDFRVKVIREGISNAANLIAESENQEYLSIPNPVLPNQRNMNLTMRAGNPGRKSRKVRVFIKWIKNDNEQFVIATLRAIVIPLKTLMLRPYRVRINRQGHQPGPNEEPNLATVQLNQAIEKANDIWRPYGIRFEQLAWRSHQVGLAHAGRVEMTNVHDEWRNVVPANYEQDKINVYFVREINGPNVGPYGAAHSPIRFSKKPGSIVESRQEGAERTGETLAHELGHYLGLANNFNNNRLSHAEDDPDAPTDTIENTHKRRDIWRVRRLMLGTRPDRLTSHIWAHRVGYSSPADPPYINGKMVTLRDLNGDKTDNECRKARDRAMKRDVYHR